MNSPTAVCDLLDANEGICQVAEPGLVHFGGRVAFSGPITTVAVFEDNALVKQMLGEPGHGGVLVVDGGASKRCALLGDILGGMAVANNWVGVVINGCVRDSKALAELPVGVMALSTMPRKGVKRGEGRRDETISFAGIHFQPGHFLYADEDGLIVAPTPLQDG